MIERSHVLALWPTLTMLKLQSVSPSWKMRCRKFEDFRVVCLVKILQLNERTPLQFYKRTNIINQHSDDFEARVARCLHRKSQSLQPSTLQQKKCSGGRGVFAPRIPQVDVLFSTHMHIMYYIYIIYNLYIIYIHNLYICIYIYWSFYIYMYNFYMHI